jgi:8-oxo-dGTP pyrophosphatase MutT (NUDIX family)
MEQNYEIFYGRHRLIFDASRQKEDNIDGCIDYVNKDLMRHLLEHLKDEKVARTYLFRVPENIKSVTSRFSVKRAGGGAVFNPDGQLMLMRRSGKWDLPKGKMDKGETMEECALREVEEECNVSGLRIKQKLIETYHFYFRKQWNIKHTYWYQMESLNWQNAAPQIEEEIDLIKWVNMDEVDFSALNTYPSIRQVIKTLKTA